MKPYRTTILFAVGLFVFDAFVLNQGAVALFVILVTLFVLLPRALWALRKSRGLYLERLTKQEFICWPALPYSWPTLCRTEWPTVGRSNWGALAWLIMRSTNAIRSVWTNSCPSSFPPCHWQNIPFGGSAVFFYASRPDGREPMLFYEAIPPFGRRFYHMATGSRGFLD